MIDEYHNDNMRTTINLADDVAKAVAKLRHERGIDLSAVADVLELLDETSRPKTRPLPDMRS